MSQTAYGYFVDGEWRHPNNDISVLEPTTNETVATVPEAGPAGVADAISSSQAATVTWDAVTPSDRGRLLAALADRIREQADQLAELETRETGRPLTDSLHMVEGAAGYFEYYAGLADKIEGRQIPLSKEGQYLDYTIREPYGVTAHVVPWNAALPLAARGFAPALAAGNTIVAKAPPKAPGSVLKLTELAHEVGIPEGVLNMVRGHGTPTGEALIADERVTAVDFTGSIGSGIDVMQLAAEHVADVHLELGGKGANIVFEDADLNRAIESVAATFQNAGQICFAPTRLFVQSSIYDEFALRAVDRIEAIDVGPGFEDPAMGPLITKDAQRSVVEYVSEAEKDGARILTGGSIPYDRGNFYDPTLIEDVPDDSPICCEEVFGPVVTLSAFETAETVVERINAVRYGLSNLVWTTDLSTAHTVARDLESGTVMINEYPILSPAAVSGGWKESGIGRAKGTQAIEAYTQSKNVIISLDDGR